MTLTLAYHEISGDSLDTGGSDVVVKGRIVRLNGNLRFISSLHPGTDSGGFGDDSTTFVAGEVDGASINQGTALDPTVSASGPYSAFGVDAIAVLPGTDTFVHLGVYEHGPLTTETLGIKIYDVDGSYNLTNVYDDVNAFGGYESEGIIGVIGVTDEKFVVVKSEVSLTGGGGGPGYTDVIIHICEWDGVTLTIGAAKKVFSSGVVVPKAWLVHQSEFEVIVWWLNQDTDRLQAVRLDLIGETLGSIQTVPIILDVTLYPNTLSATKLDDLWSLVIFQLDDDDIRGIVARVTSSTVTLGLPYPLVPTGIDAGTVDVVAINSTSCILAYSDLLTSPVELYLRELAVTIGTLSIAVGDITEVDDTVSAASKGWPALEYLGNGVIILKYGTQDRAWWYAFIGAEPGQKVLGAALSAGGAYLYVTLWIAGELALQVFNSADLSVPLYDWSLGAATLEEVDNRTYWAFPFAAGFADDEVMVFGRMNDPAGLGLVHIIWSGDAGVNFATMNDDFGDDHCGAMVANSVGQVFAIRNVVSSLGGATVQAKLYRGVLAGTLSLVSTLPFTSGVKPGAMAYDQFSNIIVGADDGQSTMIVFALHPYLVWTDDTSNYQTTDPVNTIEVIS